MKKNKINPLRIIQTIEENFKGILSKPKLKTLILIIIAIVKANKMTINEISRQLPTNVKSQKAKQTRLLRFLGSKIWLPEMMYRWTRFVIQRVYGNKSDAIIILVDGFPLIGGYKSFVAAIPFRKRAIPIAFMVYKYDQIRDMTCPSENYIIWNFMDTIIDYMKRIMPDRGLILVFDRGFADEKLMRYLEYFDSKYVMRVPKNSGIIGLGYRGKLSGFDRWGYFKEVFYHIKEQINVNLFCSDNHTKGDPLFVVSNIDGGLGLIYSRRIQIEEAFRDMKSLFGFKELSLKDNSQSRVELLFFLVIISMGLILLLYEKSGYRWSKYYNTTIRKEYSLTRVIKEKLGYLWSRYRFEPFFDLSRIIFYEV